MTKKLSPIKWAKKVSSIKIRKLYETDAANLQDEELVDEVGCGLYVRCVSILEVTEAVRGRARCHGCGNVILHHSRHDEILCCEKCNWQVTWGEYRKSYKEKQLFGGAAVAAFSNFVTKYPGAHTYRAKMLLIDRLINEFHWNLIRNNDQPKATRPVAVNIIDFTKMNDALAFLNELAGSKSEETD